MRLESLHKEGKHDFTKASRNQVKVMGCTLCCLWSCLRWVCVVDHALQIKDKRRTKQAVTDGF
jgi:hypothetical protein